MQNLDISIYCHLIECDRLCSYRYGKLRCNPETWSIFPQFLTMDTPELAREGEVWGVNCDFEV